MNILVQQIAHHAGINEEKARIALLTVSSHVKERYPLLQSVVELILEAGDSSLTDQKAVIVDFKNEIGLN
jgi:hypothetical protein